jgi:hypothetical protein
LQTQNTQKDLQLYHQAQTISRLRYALLVSGSVIVALVALHLVRGRRIV